MGGPWIFWRIRSSVSNSAGACCAVIIKPSGASKRTHSARRLTHSSPSAASSIQASPKRKRPFTSCGTNQATKPAAIDRQPITQA